MKNKPYSLALWILFLLFCFRVFAQLTQYFIPNSFLPPFEAWHSGTLSYASLVFFQFVIIGIYLSVCIRISMGKINPHKSIGKRLLVLGGIYAFIMVTRYILRMSMFPSERWFGGSIPILFHVVLASFLITLGIYHVRNGAVKNVTPGLPKRILWTSIYTILITLTFVWLIYQLLPTWIAKNIGLRPSAYSVTIEKSVPMVMSDGAVLRADIYRPEKLTTAPTILVRIPLDDNFKGKLMSNVLGRMWSERGYNVVVQGVRGRFNSTGKHIPFAYEREDGISTLQWLNQQPWHNGKTGMWGGSYFGYTQWVLADQDSLGLSALSTQISSSSNYRMFYPGGVFAYESALFWATRSHSQKDTPLDYETLRKGFDGAPLIEADDRVVGDIPFYNDWVSHDRLDTFWRAVDGIDRAKHLKVPALTMAGWYDPFLPSQVQDFEDISQYADTAISQKCKLIIGPWAHAETVTMPDGYQDRNYRFSSIAPAMSWYDEHLRNVKTEESPRVRIFVMGINQWRDETSFPLERTAYTPYYLATDLAKPGQSVLTPAPPSYDSFRQAYAFDPAHPVPSIGGSVLGPRAGAKKQNEIEGRNDVLVYTSDILTQNLEVTGKIKLILHVSTDAKSTDFMAKLCDVHADGSSFNISEGALRHAYKNGETGELEIELNPSSNVFLKGHRIRLLLSSSSYPRFSVNYNTGNENYKDQKGVIANQNVYTGRMFLSRLVLPVIPADRE
jgi:uncharacterized protein